MIKLKDILSEVKWEGKSVELGKIYSNPYANAFKPQEDTVNEFFKSVTSVKNNLKEDDHEVGMGLSSLKSSVRSAKIIYTNIKKRNIEDLDGWVQEKMTLASDYLKNVADYMEDLEEYDKDGTNN
jgi:meiotically up-regulated gene 157 (Mug157) protein|tara:strand:- start:144 stop:518 length:375 start_codon:yes stop_codon:yes gene_type:complete